jgi:hypothetical protein
VKDPRKLQAKLLHVLKSAPALKVLPNPTVPWSDLDFKEVAWIVQDFVNQNTEVIECDPLREWLEEYKFASIEWYTG